MHKPVLLEDFLLAVEAMAFKPKTYLDCTFGRGGHFLALLEKNSNIKADLIDQDLEALLYGKNKFKDLINEKQINFHHLNFMKIKEQASEKLKKQKFDLILADLGPSSSQLDNQLRGFSFYQEGPLDMRMNSKTKIKASDIINGWTEQELLDLFKNMGEVRSPLKVVKKIVEKRKEQNLETTKELSDLIEKTDGWRKKGSHPATKYFLALRMQVNDEIAPLETAIIDLIHRLNPMGRLMIISFHSMEDRIIKWAFKNNKELGKIITKKAIQAKWSEKKTNPRARSAILRVFERESNER